jgi:hypothetical protein
MAGKTPLKPTTRAPRKRAANAPARKPPAESVGAAPADEPPADSSGAHALIRAGLKALGNVRGDIAARQARIFELLLGIGQAPAWSAGPKAEAVHDPFGKFEDVFDQRVARSLERLGMPSPQSLAELAKEMKALRAQLRNLESKSHRR